MMTRLLLVFLFTFIFYRPIDVLAEDTCKKSVEKLLLIKNYQQKMLQALNKRQLVSPTFKKITANYPGLEWFLNAEKTLNNRLKNWNHYDYPAFYLFNDQEILPVITKYIEDPAPSPEHTLVDDWIKTFSNYQNELDLLIEERITLQFNINLLKKLELKADEARDIQLTIKRGGVFKNEILTLREADQNLESTIKQLEQEVKALDGTFTTNGKIKERIIRQAMLFDILSILHRKLEHLFKNTTVQSNEMTQQLDHLGQLLKNSKNFASTYGVYKINNQILAQELRSLSKLDTAYLKIKIPLQQLKETFAQYFKDKKAGTKTKKIGLLKKMYLKISTISPKKILIGGGIVLAGGISIERHFAFKNITIEEVKEFPPKEEIENIDLQNSFPPINQSLEMMDPFR